MECQEKTLIKLVALFSDLAEIVDVMTNQIKKEFKEYMKNVMNKSREKIKTMLNSSRMSEINTSLEKKSEVMKEYEKSFEDVPEKAQELKNSTEEMLNIINEHLKRYDD